MRIAARAGVLFQITLVLLTGAGVSEAQHPAESMRAEESPRVNRQTPAGPSSPGTFRFVSAGPMATIVEYDRGVIVDAVRRDQRVRVERFPLTAGRSVDLELEPFQVTSARTQFVVGNKEGSDRAYDFDASKITLLRGTVVGQPASDVFLAMSDGKTTGHVQLSRGGERFEIAGAARREASPEAKDVLQVFRASAATGPPAGMRLCGADELERVGVRSHGGSGESEEAVRVAGTPLLRGTLHIELALETDYELYSLFGDLDDAATYVVELVAAVNHIYLRDVNARYELTFVRLWDDPSDLFNEPDPLDAFLNFWNDNMGAVTRDVAHFASGRRNLPYGGIAYVGALCTDFAYGVTGYLTGSFPDPDLPSSGHYDVGVVAHELGHNCGTGHTHSYGIDNCNNFDGVPQRGTIMSYCSQTYSGGAANWDMYFHTFIEGIMEEFMANDASCLAVDCNRNNVSDSFDISDGTSVDLNSNGMPDECEDCDGDGILNPAELAAGSTDLDQNGNPDECDPNCNGNGSVDIFDIAQGTSQDAHGNHIPDECEPDCDDNNVSDYNQIQLNMSLDLNRNTVLDSCEDCDGDGTTDLAELNGAWNVWAASGNADGAIREFHADVGTRIRISGAGQVNGGQDVVITPTGRIFVSSANTDRVVEFNRQGNFVGVFVPTGSGGLDYPTGLVLMPGGDLLVASRNNNAVLRYDGVTGASEGVFVLSGSGGLTSPFGMAYGLNGHLYVTSNDGRVLEYDGSNGAFVRVHVSAANNGGLSGPRGMAFKPNGNLLVASFMTNQVLEYAAGTGAFVGQFNKGGTATALTMDEPWGVRIGPNGHVFVARHNEALVFEEEEHPPGVEELHLNSTRIYMFHVDSGIFLRSFVTGNDTGLVGTTGFAFMPGGETDCNLNFRPDNCDIAEGTSADVDGNGAPDECGCLAFGGPAPEPGGVGKSRYVTFSVSGVGPNVALRVTLTNLEGFPGSNGEVRWIGPWASHPETGQGAPSFTAAGLQCEPFQANWSSLGLLHVYGVEVVPGSTYMVEAVSGCSGEVLGSVEVTTGKWGDAVTPFGGQSQPNFGDISAIVESFRTLPTAPSVTSCDLEPALPNQNPNFADISADVEAFRGLPYPFAGPGPCQ